MRARQTKGSPHAPENPTPKGFRLDTAGRAHRALVTRARGCAPCDVFLRGGAVCKPHASWVVTPAGAPITSALRRLARPLHARAVGVVRCGAAINITGEPLPKLSFWRSSKIQNTLAISDRTSVPACRQGPANRPPVQQQPTKQTEPRWFMITNPAVINDRSMNSLQPQLHDARWDTTVLSCTESTPRCATSPKSARRSGPPPPFGTQAARPILARDWPAYPLDDPKILTCRGRCWWSCRSSMRSASPARARTSAHTHVPGQPLLHPQIAL